MHDFTDFPLEKFYDIWTQQCQSVSPCKLLEQNFENFIIGVKKRKSENETVRRGTIWKWISGSL